MLRADKLGAFGRLIRIHVVHPIAGKRCIVELHGGQLAALHVLCHARVAGGIEALAVEVEHVANALIGRMVIVIGLHCLDLHAVRFRGEILVARGMQVLRADDRAARRMRHLVDSVMVEVVVGDQDEVGLELVLLSEIRIDVDDRIVVERESVGAMPLE